MSESCIFSEKPERLSAEIASPRPASQAAGELFFQEACFEKVTLDPPRMGTPFSAFAARRVSAVGKQTEFDEVGLPALQRF